MNNDVKQLKLTFTTALIMLIVLLLVVSGATFAWFTFTTSSVIEPMSGTISGGGASLLISDSADGPFTESCELKLTSSAEELEPVTTADLKTFYAPVKQNREGIPSEYKDISENTDKMMLKGTLYLRSEGGSCSVYLHRNALDFSDDIQALASLRLGLKIDCSEGDYVYIFKLDDMADVRSAESKNTISEEGKVYSGEYVEDPAKVISTHAASGGEEDLTAEGSSLFTIHSDETAKIDYFLYLEGCDENCINVVQSSELALQLGFAGLDE